MILHLLVALANPGDYAITWKHGEIHLAPIDELEASGSRVISR